MAAYQIVKQESGIHCYVNKMHSEHNFSRVVVQDKETLQFFETVLCMFFSDGAGKYIADIYDPTLFKTSNLKENWSYVRLSCTIYEDVVRHIILCPKEYVFKCNSDVGWKNIWSKSVFVDILSQPQTQTIT